MKQEVKITRMCFEFKKFCKSKRRFIITVACELSILFIIVSCTGGEEIVFDPVNVNITQIDDTTLQATVVFNTVEYTPSNWPSNFSNPIFIWKEKDPRSNNATYKVTYIYDRRQDSGENLWTFAANDSEGTYYYWTHVTFTDDEAHMHQGQSQDGRNLYRILNRSGYDDSHCNIAGGYVRVPYVLGIVQDVNGDDCGKTIDNGYRGIDCSGLAWYSGYEGDEKVGYTNAADLEVDYGKDIPFDSLEKIIDPDSALKYLEYLDGCMVFIDYDKDGTVDHVGIILNQDSVYYGEVIHATAADKIKPWYEHGCMVMREELDDRPDYWNDSTKFVDIGREPMNAKVGIR